MWSSNSSTPLSRRTKPSTTRTPKIFKAHGNVYYRNYDHERSHLLRQRRVQHRNRARHISITCKGYTKTKVVARPGVLTTQEPFYFEGEYAEKIEDKYMLHDGIITDCHIPHPWWTLHGNLFDIIPDDRAITHNAIFHLREFRSFISPISTKP